MLNTYFQGIINNDGCILVIAWKWYHNKQCNSMIWRDKSWLHPQSSNFASTHSNPCTATVREIKRKQLRNVCKIKKTYFPWICTCSNNLSRCFTDAIWVQQNVQNNYFLSRIKSLGHANTANCEPSSTQLCYALVLAVIPHTLVTSLKGGKGSVKVRMSHPSFTSYEH